MTFSPPTTDSAPTSTPQLDDLVETLEQALTKAGTDAAGRKKAAVFGAGIAGLTAAHELAERGFEVAVTR